MQGLEVFNYKGNNVSFQNDNGIVMVNATQMGRPFGKFAKDWLSNRNTKEYLNELSSVRRIPLTELVKIIQGGTNQGTFFFEDVALEYSRWLSPKFSIWCNDKIKELLNTGSTEINSTNEDQAILHALNILQKRVSIQNGQLQLQAPKVEYFDDVLQSKNTYTTTLVAKELGYTAQKLNKILHEKGIQFKQGDCWVLYKKYQSQGYTKPSTYRFTNTRGESDTRMQMEWTEVGRKFIHDTVGVSLKLVN